MHCVFLKVLLRKGTFEGLTIVFAQRHQLDVTKKYAQPRNVNFHALALALKSLNCKLVLGTYSVGSMKSSIPVGTLLLIGDWWNPYNILTLHDDYTSHVIPILNEDFKATISKVLRQNVYVFQEGTTYVQSNGPRFETQAEIR